MSDEALNLADDLANASKQKHMWQFEDAAKHIRAMAAEIKELQKKIKELEKAK